MKTSYRFPPPAALLVALSMTLAACQRQAEPVTDFVPPEGDATAGQLVFVGYQCHACHDIDGIDLPERTSEPPLVLKLGTRMHRVRNYGELLTAIANPDHTQSPKFLAAVKATGREAEFTAMPDYTGRMSVSEFVDLATFLDTQYRRLQPRSYR